jgi:hypothetical protein
MLFLEIKRALMILLVLSPLLVGIAAPVLINEFAAAQVSEEVVGTAIADSRDLNGAPFAPVEFTLDGSAQSEFVYGVYTTGEQVSFTVTADGSPIVVEPWGTVFLLSCIGALLGTLVSVAVWFTATDSLERQSGQILSAKFDRERRAAVVL